MTKTLLIDKQSFIDWYFDHDICKEFFNRHDILESLTEKVYSLLHYNTY